MTQISPQQPQAPAAPAKPPVQQQQPERRAEITRVIVLGTPLQFEKGKLWPQGPAQEKVAKLSMEVWILENWLANEQNQVHREQWVKYSHEVKEKRKVLKEERDKIKVAEQPIECVVSQINELVGDLSTGMPARVEMIGQPFGLWAERQLSATMRFAVEQCGILKRYPLEELVSYVDALEAAEAAEAAKAAAGGDDEGDEDDEDETDDEEEGEEEETAGDLLVEAAIHAIPQATIELREEGSVAVLPMAAWERLSAAADAWAEEQKAAEEEGDEDEDEGDEEDEDEDEDEEEENQGDAESSSP